MSYSLDDIVQQTKDGEPIFLKLFALSDKELKSKLELYGDETINQLLKGNPRVTKTIVDEKPTSIKLEFYNSIEIDWRGISYQPEHGPPSRILIFAEKKDNEFLKFINED